MALCVCKNREPRVTNVRPLDLHNHFQKWKTICSRTIITFSDMVLLVKKLFVTLHWRLLHANNATSKKVFRKWPTPRMISLLKRFGQLFHATWTSSRGHEEFQAQKFLKNAFQETRPFFKQKFARLKKLPPKTFLDGYDHRRERSSAHVTPSKQPGHPEYLVRIQQIFDDCLALQFRCRRTYHGSRLCFLR